MIVRSNVLTLDDIHDATRGTPNVHYQDTYSREGWFVPVREFKPKRFARGFEFFLSGSGKYNSAHDNQEKSATWVEWGIVIAAIFAIDPNAQVGFYRNRSHFIDYTRSEAFRPGCEFGLDEMPWLLSA